MVVSFFRIFTPIPGKIQFDKCFSTGLEPPTKKSLMTHFDTNQNVTIEAPTQDRRARAHSIGMFSQRFSQLSSTTGT